MEWKASSFHRTAMGADTYVLNRNSTLENRGRYRTHYPPEVSADLVAVWLLSCTLRVLGVSKSFQFVAAYSTISHVKINQRMAFLFFGPAIIGSVLLVARMAIASPRDVPHAISLLPVVTISALVLSIIPAAIYTAIMELWLRLVEKRFRLSWTGGGILSMTIALSTLLGGAAGWVITRVNGNPFIGIGAMTGLLLGAFIVTQRSSSYQPKRE